MPILQIRDENGNFVPIPVLKGNDGKSAYEQAKEGGYKGTLEEFIALLNGMTSTEDAAHYADFNNPHRVTKEQVGLGNVDNTPDAEKPVSRLQQEALLQLGSSMNVCIAEHASNANNPHGVTAEQTGALPRNIGSSNSNLRVDIGNYVYVRDKYDSEVPEIPAISNFTHYITIDENNKVTAVLSVPIDYTNKAYYYTRNDKKWHEIDDASQRFASGTYSGTGGGGDSKPNSLTFPFKPKLVFIALESPQTNRSDVTQPLLYGSKIGLVVTATSTNWGAHNTYPLNLVWSGNTLTWTYTLNTSSVEQHQLNISGSTYTWLAIG